MWWGVLFFASRCAPVILKQQAAIALLTVGFFSWAGMGFAVEDLKVETPGLKAKLSFQQAQEGKVLVSVLNEEGDPVLGLQKKDFLITQGPKRAEIISVEDVAEQRDIGLNVVLVVDNSYSMKLRGAVNPVLAALNEFLSLIRPIDDVHVITFDDPRSGQARMSSVMARGADPATLGQTLRNSYTEPTDGTYLYDAMRQGLDVIQSMPEKSQKFMVIFSDGEDINSIVKTQELQAGASGLKNFVVYAVDYMDRPGLDPFLKSFAEGSGGQIRKARSSEDFLPIFKQFSTTIFHRYGVAFRFLNPPEGTIASAPPIVNIEEVTMVDSSPLLNYVYFDTGEREIPSRYSTFAGPEETGDFAEEKLTGTMEKYYHILNVIGKRLAMNPEAGIRIVGCNSDMGEEKGQLALSRSRADAVFAYFRYVWGIAPERMEASAGNLPAVPSTSRVPEGRAENQRVEIYSDHPAILDTIKSIYVEEQSDASEIKIIPAIQAETVITDWQLKLMGGGETLLTREGTGKPPEEFVFAIDVLGIRKVASLGQITYEGVGPNDPPYDNALPEGRALNRTVLITIEYME